MKRNLLLKTMLLLCALVVGSGSVWANDVPYLTLTFPDDNSANNGVQNYTSTWTAKSGTFDFSITNFNNNKYDGWSFIKCGRKKAGSPKVDVPSVATVTTSSSIDKIIPKVVVTLAAIDNSDVNSIKLYVASNSSFTEELQEIEVTVPSYAEDLIFNVPTPKANMFYKLEVDTKGSTSANGTVTISKIAYCLTSEPNSAITTDTYTETATINSDGTQNTEGTCITTSGNISKTAKYGYSYGLKLESNSGVITITTPTGATNAKVELLNSASGIATLKLDGTSSSVLFSGNSEIGYKTTVNIPDSKAGNAFTIEKGGGSPVIYCIKLTYELESATNVYLTTTAELEGWRTFYDASQDYAVDANTKIYVVKAKSTKDNVVELTALDATKVKAGTPVILKTSALDHKLVLTKTTGAADLGDNLLAFAASTAVDGYRMGYKSGTGIGFYKYTATAPASGVVYIGNDNVVSSAHEFLAFSFDNETTGIANLNVDVNDNFDANAPMYNLAGQRVNKNYKGVIIQNGRKYLNK